MFWVPLSYSQVCWASLWVSLKCLSGKLLTSVSLVLLWVFLVLWVRWNSYLAQSSRSGSSRRVDWVVLAGVHRSWGAWGAAWRAEELPCALAVHSQTWVCARCRALLGPLCFEMGVPGVCTRLTRVLTATVLGWGALWACAAAFLAHSCSSRASLRVCSSPRCPDCCWALRPSAGSLFLWGGLPRQPPFTPVGAV